MATHSAPTTAGSRETLWAILGSLLIAIVVATLLAGNPFRALRLAYLDYSHTPADGAAKTDSGRAATPQPAAK